MGLDIAAFPPGPPTAPPVLAVTLEDDGYFWFLHPHFEAAGFHLDLYGDSMFGTGELERVKKVLERAAEALESKPATFQVSIGKTVEPVEEVFLTVTKADFRGLLAGLRRVLEEAERLGGYVECTGD